MGEGEGKKNLTTYITDTGLWTLFNLLCHDTLCSTEHLSSDLITLCGILKYNCRNSILVSSLVVKSVISLLLKAFCSPDLGLHR